MIRFVPASQGEPLTRALWRLAVPDQETGATDKMFEVFDDLQTPSQRWLMVDTTFAIRVHEQAVFDGITDILQPWIDDGYLPADTNTNLAAFVESKRGEMLTVYDAFPQLFKDMSKTAEEMQALNLLPQPI